jgi:hypothetical protein
MTIKADKSVYAKRPSAKKAKQFVEAERDWMGVDCGWEAERRIFIIIRRK